MNQHSLLSCNPLSLQVLRLRIKTCPVVVTLPVPHKAVPEVSEIGNLQERLVVVNHGWQSEPTDGSKGGWSVRLSICLSVYLPACLSLYLSVCLSVYLSTYLPIYLPIYRSINVFVHLFAHLSAYLPLYLSIPSIGLSALEMKLFYETSLVFEHPKGSKFARLPQYLTTSRKKQFCETSLKNGKLSAELTASCHCVLRFSHSICLKYCACQEKI